MIYPNSIAGRDRVQPMGPTNGVMELAPAAVVSLAEDMEIYSVNDLLDEQAMVYMASADLFYTMQQNDHPLRHMFEPAERYVDIERGHLGHLFGTQVLINTAVKGPTFAAVLLAQESGYWVVKDYRCYRVRPQEWQQ